MTTGRTMLPLVYIGLVLAGCHPSPPRTVGRRVDAPAAGPARVLLRAAVPRAGMDSQHVTVLEVRYRPGDASPPHSHPCPVFGYVAEGTLRSQVGTEAEQRLAAGTAFYEPAHGAHRVSANASRTHPVRFVAVFVCHRAERLSIPLASPGTTTTPAVDPR